MSEARAAFVEDGLTALRWSTAAALAAVLHFGAAWAVLHRQPAETVAGAPAPAALVELEPLTVAPTAPAAPLSAPPSAESQTAEKPPTVEPSLDAAPAPSEIAADNAEPNAAAPDASAPPTAEPPPDAAEVAVQSKADDALAEAPAPPTVEPAPDAAQVAAENKTDDAKPDASAPPTAPDALAEAPAPVAPSEAQPAPELPQRQSPEAEFAPTQASEPGAPSLEPSQSISPSPVIEERAEPATIAAPPPRPATTTIENNKPNVERVQRSRSAKTERKPDLRRLASAPPASEARQGEIAAAPVSGAATSAPSMASWRGELLAHLNRFKRFPPEAAKGGTAVVAFGVDRAGVIVSVKLVASAGDPALDEAAVGLLRRASPVPAPPPFERSVIDLTVPIKFDR